ncbi:MAG: AAA family ATPase [Deltaproteobacteria bacterium]|jgi:ATP-dependent 26S proteasome regulatory subunit|nr:AAA family ATPase [Deltaproteobacteria bacterium]
MLTLLSERNLASYIDALRPIIYITHFDFQAVDSLIEKVANGVRIVEYNNALGAVDFKTKNSQCGWGLEEFLRHVLDYGFDGQTFILLKNIHNQLDDEKIIALLTRISENNLYRNNYYATIFIISSTVRIIPELEQLITLYDFPLPKHESIVPIISNFCETLGIKTDDNDRQILARSFIGLNEFQIGQILNLAYQNGGTLSSKKDNQLILKEKEQIVKKSGMVEFINFRESLDDIGGLENLKDWLISKRTVIQNLDRAIRYGVDVPKGVMIIGMPGCGKSLTAKVAASLFGIPLIRLDVGRLFGKYVGESEENMRKALALAEASSPCVLWIDEIEKAFAGIGGSGGGSDITTRLFGQFLTWMQEKENTVFVIATANDISNLPPEFLRKGRFDELFFVDLPNEDERQRIFEIHLKKRQKFNKTINYVALIEATRGYNGADIEYVVKDTIENSFIKNKTVITTEDILASIKNTKSISDALKDKIEKIIEIQKRLDIKQASRPSVRIILPKN